MLITQKSQLDTLFNENDSFIFISRLLIEKLKSTTTTLILQRIFLESKKYQDDEFFPLPKKKFVEKDLISISRVTSDIDILKDLKIIETTIRDVPPVTFIKINLQNLYNFCYE